MARWTQWRWWKTHSEKVAEFAPTRQPLAAEAFLNECALPDDEEARRIAVAVRRSIAKMLTVEPALIRGADREAVELRALWDSVDFLEWVMTVEQELKLVITDDVFKGLRPGYTVRDLILCVYAGRSNVKSSTPPTARSPARR
jgi:acyl carrier protein